MKVLAVLVLVGLAARTCQERLTGLRLTVDMPPGRAGPQALERRASEVSSDVLLFDPDIRAGVRSARFEGFFWVEADGSCILVLKGRDAADVWVDDTLVFHDRGGARPRERSTIELRRGLHALRAEFRNPGRVPNFKLSLPTEAGVPARALFPERPSSRNLATLPSLTLLGRASVLVWPLALLGVAHAFRCKVRHLSQLLATAVVLYAGGLRVDSVVRQYWGLDAPGWARHVTSVVDQVAPRLLRLPPEQDPYTGDPSAYLRYARAMEHFYDAHVREPLFVLATRASLAMSGGADIGISLASACFSTLMVLATYLLGASCFNRRVGLLAALLLAIEPQVIELAAAGWRDEAFGLWLLLTTLALVRLQRAPTFANAMGAGLAGGAACLTRITSLSFLLPALLVACFQGDASGRGRRLRAAGLSLAIALLVVAPYLASCAIAFGDPFLAINTHTGFYRDRAGLPSETAMSWASYLLSAFKPAELARNLLVGLTTYPFANKWLPYNLWLPRAATVLRALSFVGLLLLLKHPKGRFLLVVLMTALLPFAFTWGVSGGSAWRLTLFAYPFYLLAAAHAVDRGLAWLGAVTANGLASPRAPRSGPPLEAPGA